MKIHEYQAKEILAKYGVAVPRGEVANTPEEASAVARKLFAEGASGVVVKAQIHAGGRGKGGGVKVARNREDADMHVKNILGMQLITHQTGPQGQKVQRLLVEETAAIDRELYLGIVLDRATGKLVFMASQAGGSRRRSIRQLDSVPGRLGNSLLHSDSRPRRSTPPSLFCRASTRHLLTRTPRCLRSIHSSRPRTKSCLRSTPRSTLTTTPCSATLS